MKKLLVTGASGFLGGHLCLRARKAWEVFGVFLSHPLEIAGVTGIRADLTDRKEMKRLFREVGPEAVIHAAAERDPGYCQRRRPEAEKINVEASVNIAALCAEAAIPCVFTSTDLVFDGQNPPYREEDPVKPINFYGEQKARAEKKMRKRYPSVTICRLSLIFGIPVTSSPSFIQPMIASLRAGRGLHLFVDEFRTPVSVTAAAEGLFLALGNVPGIVHLGGRERVSRYEFGRLLAEIAGIRQARLVPVRQKEIVLPVPRPPDVSLDSRRALKLGFRPLSLREELERIGERL